jgi:hypothetical protein
VVVAREVITGHWTGGSRTAQRMGMDPHPQVSNRSREEHSNGKREGFFLVWMKGSVPVRRRSAGDGRRRGADGDQLGGVDG